MVKEPDTLEEIARQWNVPVSEIEHELVQIGHRFGEDDGALVGRSEFLPQKLIPRLCPRILRKSAFVTNPEGEVRILLRQIIEQILDLFRRRNGSEWRCLKSIGLRLLEQQFAQASKDSLIQTLKAGGPMGF